MTEHQWEPFGEWGGERTGWSRTFKCSRCGAFKLDDVKVVRHLHDGKVISEETVPNDESFEYLDCDTQVVKRIMES